MLVSFFVLFFKFAIVSVFAPLCLFNLFSRVGIRDDYKLITVLAISPITVSWVYVSFLRVLPHQHSYVYLFLVFISFFIFFPRKKIVDIIFNEIKNLRMNLNLFEKINLFFILCLFFIIFYNYYYLYISANDSLEYVYLSSLIDQMKSVSFYPSTTAVDARGFIAPWTHPAGYPGLLAWGRLGIDSSMALLSSQLFSFYLMLMLVGGLSFLELKSRMRPVFLSAIVLLATPLCFYSVSEIHVDHGRMLLYFLPLLVIWGRFDFLKEKQPEPYDWRFAVFVGFLCGMSWFLHASGVLTIFFTVITYLFLRFMQLSQWNLIKKDITYVLAEALPFFMTALLVVTPDLLANYKVYGSVLGDLDIIPVYKTLKEDYTVYYSLSRALPENLLGMLAKFASIMVYLNCYGFSYLLFLMFLILAIYYRDASLRMSNIENRTARFILYQALFFWGVVFILTFLGIKTFLFNVRYILQVQPFVCILGALYLRRLFRFI